MPRGVWWVAAMGLLTAAAQIGSTPRRSDDLRVALMSTCPLDKGTLESGGAAEVVSVLVDAAGGAALKTAVQIANAYGQPHASPPRLGATAEHFYLLRPDGEVRVNRQLWSCLVVTVTDLRAAPGAGRGPAPAPASASAPGAAAGGEDAAGDPYPHERVFLEARIVHAADGSAFELQPVTLRFRASDEASLLGSAARDLRFDIVFGTPGAREPFARAVIDFRALVPSPRAQWRSDQLGQPLAKRSGWLPAPPLSVALTEQARERRAAAAGAGAGAAARRTGVHGPTTVTVSLVETRDGSLLWRWFGEWLAALSTALPGKG